MSELISNIGEIVSLAKKVRKHLDKYQINKAIRELQTIIELDLNELRRLQAEHGDKRLLQECIEVLSAAKKALRNLEAGELNDEVKQLMDKIIGVEGHILKEVERNEPLENVLYNYWYNNIYNGIVYHGTSTISLDRIKRYGLVPGMRSFDLNDFRRLKQLMEISGAQNPLGLFHFINVEGQEIITNGFFLTFDYESVKEYADPSPTMWREFVGKDVWDKHDINSAIRNLVGLISFPRYSLSSNNWEEFSRLFFRYKAKFYFTMLQDFYTRKGLDFNSVKILSTNEFRELLAIFRKLWAFFSQPQMPVILHVSARAPAIQAKLIGMGLGNFNSFIRHMKMRRIGLNPRNIKEYFSVRLKQVFITHRIPGTK